MMLDDHQQIKHLLVRAPMSEVPQRVLVTEGAVIIVRPRQQYRAVLHEFAQFEYWKVPS